MRIAMCARWLRARFHHRFPTGELVSIEGVFDEVVAPARLRFTVHRIDSAIIDDVQDR
jgi:hypothetical protein